MHFVNQIKFHGAGRRHVFDVVNDDVADFFDLGVGGGVEFQHVQTVAGGDGQTFGTVVARFGRRRIFAAQTFRKNSGDGRLAGAARTAEQVGVGDAFLFDGVGERLGD